MNSGGGDDQSSPLPGGEFLLRLLQRLPQHPPQTHHHSPPPLVGHTISHPPIQSNGQDHPTPHPPFAPHAYINRFPPKPISNSESSQILGNFQSNIAPPTNPDTRPVFGDSGENITGFSEKKKTHEGKVFYNPSGNSPSSTSITEGKNGSESNPNFGRIGEGYNRALNGYEANYRNYPNFSGTGEGFNGVTNGYEANYRNYSNLSGFGEGYNGVMNGYEANYRNTPNLSRVGEGYNRALDGYKANYRNSPNSSRSGEVYNRALNGHEADYRNSPNMSRIGNNMALNGYQNFPNSSRIHRGNNGVLNRPDFDSQKNSSFSRNQGTTSRTVQARQEVRQPPPGLVKKKNNRKLKNKVNKEKDILNGSKEEKVKHEDEREKGVMPGIKRNDVVIGERRLSTQLDSPHAGSALPLVSGCEVEGSLSDLHTEITENGEKQTKVVGRGLVQDDLDDVEEQMVGSLEEEIGSNDKKGKKKRDKDYRLDTRGQRVLSPAMRKTSRRIECRIDIDMLNVPLLAIYNSLIPPEEEKMKQRQLLALLENLVIKEWPEAQLFVYGSCANSFGVRNSDIDICLTMKDDDLSKSEVLLKLADILKAEKLENVQALTHARVPIVKLMDPSTGISCDICINNVLAVVNSKLLRDYAKIDDRLRQLAFIVKHWAKSRGVNETYYGTLSSYAYVLMCIHFLQQCRPAILPCLQEMDPTYSVVADNVECAFFDQVEKLSGFGLRNKESIGRLVWGFFRHWAYCHEYSHDVVSVRVGGLISKRAKDWTRRVGQDRHLICIEDPFEITHDLGRVVDKFSIKVLKEEFERAAEILQFDPNPCVKLFEPFVRS